MVPFDFIDRLRKSKNSEMRVNITELKLNDKIRNSRLKLFKLRVPYLYNLIYVKPGLEED